MVDYSRIEKCGLNEAFDPAHPITPRFFCGREDLVDRINVAIGLKGGHVVLYGDRGVGKTSLAKFCQKNFSDNGNHVQYIPCSNGSTFATIVARLFSSLGIVVEKTETTETGVSIAYILGLSGSKSTQTSTRIDINTAAGVADALKNNINSSSKSKNIIIIDEFDTLTNVEDKRKFAQLMKLLSDNGTNLYFIFVGISLDVEDLLGGHASIVRSLTEVNIKRMNEDELHSIIQKGEERTGLTFDEEVKEKIVKMSLGFPYYTHSLAFESAKYAVLDERNNINLNDLEVGIKDAIDNIDKSLKTQYNESVGVNESLLKRQLLYCAAILGNHGSFTMKQWIDKYNEIYKEDIQNVTINSQMQQVINKGSNMLKSLRKGKYVFTNSLMPSYINILGKP